jgi:hypothetical protein
MKEKKRISYGLLIVLIVCLLLVACGDTSAPPVTATVVSQPTVTPTRPVTTPPVTATVITSNPAPAQTITVATTTAPANVTPPAPVETPETDNVPLSRSTINVPKLDDKSDGLVLFEENGNIWVLSLPEGIRTPLTKDSPNNKFLPNRNPVWSPDSLQIAFASNQDALNETGYNGGYDVYTMRPDGSNLNRVTKDNNSVSVERLPLAWFSTGEILVKQLHHGGNPLAGQVAPLILLDPATGKSKALPVNDPAYDTGAVTTSPDKTQLAYVTRKPGANASESKVDISLVALSGGTPKAITNFPAAKDTNIPVLVWSPDSKSLAFLQTNSCSYKLYTLDKNGSTPRMLYEGKGEVSSLSYAPRGKWLVYSSGGECADGAYKLRLLDTEKGGAPVELTTGYNPSYGRKIGA